MQTDYVDAISEDIKKIEGELQVKERREQHKKNIFDRLSGKIDKEVPALSIDTGSGCPLIPQ